MGSPKPESKPVNESKIDVMGAQSFLESMQLMFQQLSAVLENYGIQMYIYKVKLYKKQEAEGKPIDEDCPDARFCIDYIVRIKCRTDYICAKLKESIKAEQK